MSDRSLSDTLNDFTRKLSTKETSVQDIIEHFEERSIAFFLFICALPAAIPMPGLGINLIIAAPLVLLTLQQVMIKKHVWLPLSFRQKTISSERLRTLTGKADPWIRRAEALTHPRLSVITRDEFKPLIGLLGFVMALSVCIPLPLTNTVPSMGIALMSLGVMTRDGLAVAAGATLGLAWVLLIGTLFLVLGAEGLDLLKETIKSLI